MRRRGGASGLFRGLARRRLPEQLFSPISGARGPVCEPGGGGQGGLSRERQCGSSRGGGGAGPVYIHLEEEDVGKTNIVEAVEHLNNFQVLIFS